MDNLLICFKSQWVKFWFGLFLGMIAICSAIEIVRAFTSPNSVDVALAFTTYIGRLKWLYDYQTLFTGAAAVVAAAFSIREIRRQIDAAAEIEKNRIEAKRAAARAMLPHTLSSLCSYAEQCAQILNQMRNHLCHNVYICKTSTLPIFPQIPENGMEGVREMVEYSPPEDRLYYWEMAKTLQVQRARISRLAETSDEIVQVHANNIDSYLADCAAIHCYASNLFEYARGEKDEIPSEADQFLISSTIQILKMRDDELFRFIFRAVSKDWEMLSIKIQNLKNERQNSVKLL